MPELNKDRIFNESPTKVLIREYNSLKNDYSRLNALKYKEYYENEPLSFVIENSRYIFSEPIAGLGFYKNIMENSVIPYDKIEDEYCKVIDYYNEFSNNMSDSQKHEYEMLIESMTNVIEDNKNSINLYNGIMENTDEISYIYDVLYEYQNGNNEDKNLEILQEFVDASDASHLMDITRLSCVIEEVSPNVFNYLNKCYNENASTPEDYSLNTFTTNVLSRMISDKYVRESVDNISNVNTRHLIQGLSGVVDSETLESVSTEIVKNYTPIYSTPTNSINKIFEDEMYAEMYEEENNTTKLNNLLCEKAIINMNLGFMYVDEMTCDEDEIYRRSSIVEKLCVESNEIEKIPNEFSKQILLLESELNRINNEIVGIVGEKYFSNNGGASKVIATSVGTIASDETFSKKDIQDNPAMTTYTPPSTSIDKDEDKDEDDKDEKDKNDDNKEEENDDKESQKKQDEDDDKEYQKRQEAKARKTDKYANMDIDDKELSSISQTVSEASDDGIKKPEKRNIFQRIQNKAIDTNVKFKRKLANMKRKKTDARNAGKAVATIPMNIADSAKKQVEKWDEADDNRRKEYMIKPGTRKVYFRTLRYGLMHFGAFQINPILNIVLVICRKLSSSKNDRIRNELTRELQAEIRVTEEKIEDAKAAGENDKKYKLMRIKEKLEAELARVGMNSKTI